MSKEEQIKEIIEKYINGNLSIELVAKEICLLADVSHKRELLIGYAKKTFREHYSAVEEFELKRIDEYLSNL